MYYIPVVDKNQCPLMPTTAARARKWIKTKKATPFWKRGVFCVRLNAVYYKEYKQPIALGVDPGSKREGLTIKSKIHTYLNILSDSVGWVSEKLKSRRNARRARRLRNTPCRKNRVNRMIGGIPPSIKARWQWKLRLISWLRKLFPITKVVVEDIKANTNNKKGNLFSSLQTGKNWFYSQIPDLITKSGIETYNERNRLGLIKTKNKLANVFEAHNVDSFVLASFQVGGTVPNNKSILHISPLNFIRRQLHLFQPHKGGTRRRYGGTMSKGWKKGSLLMHKKYGLVYLGGEYNSYISIHELTTGKRITSNAKQKDCKYLTYNTWRWVFINHCNVL